MIQDRLEGMTGELTYDDPCLHWAQWLLEGVMDRQGAYD